MRKGSTTSNLVLIGMPGAGKSTIGVLLAKELGKGFIDTDIVTQQFSGRVLQEILDGDGYLALRQAEEDAILQMQVTNHVVATGGSAAHSHAAMVHLATDATIVFLDVTLQTIRARVQNFDSRGIACPPEQSLDDLFAERLQLYRRYAHVTIRNDDLNQDETVAAIRQAVGC